MVAHITHIIGLYVRPVVRGVLPGRDGGMTGMTIPTPFFKKIRKKNKKLHPTRPITPFYLKYIKKVLDNAIWLCYSIIAGFSGL